MKRDFFFFFFPPQKEGNCSLYVHILHTKVSWLANPPLPPNPKKDGFGGQKEEKAEDERDFWGSKWGECHKEEDNYVLEKNVLKEYDVGPSY